ncbi:MAG: efflux RND transporter periplasmic adaptor subunit [Thermoguttaceae bacterium]|nr:efflux RND transporter periplasmic adaptor subunit [Thermoguttaceae bacterium]
MARFSGAAAQFDEPEKVESSEEVPRVEFYVVKNERVPLVRETPGRVVASKVAQVRPKVGGVLLKRLFEEGSFVDEGDVLYEIESDVYQANYDKAEANYEELKRRQARAALLKDKQATSQEEYESSLFAFKQAKAEFDLAALDLDYCQVKAPISGKIGFSSITVGALVSSAQENELATIQQIDPVYVDVNPSAVFLANAKKNGANDFLQDARVELILEDGTTYDQTGRIQHSDNAVQEDVGTIALRAVFPNPNGTLLPGMFVRARVEEGAREDGKKIPQQALFRDPKGNPYVWVVRDDSTVERRSIESERTIDGFALVDSNLDAGERVVVEGSQFIADGTLVDAVEHSQNAPGSSD